MCLSVVLYHLMQTLLFLYQKLHAYAKVKSAVASKWLSLHHALAQKQQASSGSYERHGRLFDISLTSTSYKRRTHMHITLPRLSTT